jgi:hypothetical protein
MDSVKRKVYVIDLRVPETGSEGDSIRTVSGGVRISFTSDMNKKEMSLGLGSRKFYSFLVAVLSLIAIACLIFALLFDINFIAGTLSILPVPLYHLHLSFISIAGDKIVIHRIFRDTLEFPIGEYERVSLTFFSIPGANTITIFFRDGQSFRFSGGGFHLAQIASEIQAAKNNISLNN